MIYRYLSGKVAPLMYKTNVLYSRLPIYQFTNLHKVGLMAANNEFTKLSQVKKKKIIK